jgi:hypothetical protein
MQPMSWRDLIRGERGEITPHASRGTHEFDQAYGFDLEEHPSRSGEDDRDNDLDNAEEESGDPESHQ